MTDLKQFAERITKAANRAEYLMNALEWLDTVSRDTILNNPSVELSQRMGCQSNGYCQAMELVTGEMKNNAEATAQVAYAKALKELADIEDMFARFAKQENAS
ncbi:hypothetical protein DXT96_07525 [Agrobacterium sp. ICMP 6402]|uniref:hypothetical protein n=1 Tax=Agrobacterium sp. ICMP 6402 TaxID=2292443 RepID=UPI0012950C49|nr:hypothetical protein [Agrobacterium sp. ICMP 6402]MQB09704.1 hypothetical protein [Agrobacterium sp. ICMP 6402]